MSFSSFSDDDNDPQTRGSPGIFEENSLDRSRHSSEFAYVEEGARDVFNEEDGTDSVRDVLDEGDETDSMRMNSVEEGVTLEMYYKTHPNHMLDQRMREITDEDSLWSVSTRRLPWGVENLRDNNPLTYWFSDCPNQKGAHTIDVIFSKPTWIKQVSLFIDYFQDNSYTPWIVSIRGGTCYRDMQEIMQIECEKTVGWQHADLEETGECTRVFRLQIAILSTHENGRDTHIRQAKVYSIPG